MLGPAMAIAEPVRLTDHLPDWLSLSGTTRWRVEGFVNAFRPGDGQDEAVIAGRTLVLAELHAGRVSFGVEIQDSRIYSGGVETPLLNVQVNPVDFLAAYARISLKGWLPEAWTGRLTIGRQTIDVGSRRFISRNGFRNTINAFTGLSLELDGPARDRTHLFYFVPVDRQPASLQRLADLDAEFDREVGNLRYWGVYHIRPVGPVNVTTAFYGLHEDDSSSQATANQDLYTPSWRISRPPRPGSWDLDWESALQFGTTRATANPLDTRDLPVFAHFHHVEVGYTFPTLLSPRLALEYDFASGDEDPADDRIGRFDTLFGSRRFDYAHTGISGPFSRGNIEGGGVRLDVHQGRFDGNLRYKALELESATDDWVGVGLVDPSGQSGRFLGHMVDGRVRYWLIPDSVRGEIGGTVLTQGRFRAQAPDAPVTGTFAYGYVMVTLRF